MKHSLRFQPEPFQLYPESREKTWSQSASNSTRLFEDAEQSWEDEIWRSGASSETAQSSPYQRLIQDRTHLTPKDKRKTQRDLRTVCALVLHQMAFSRGNDPKKYDSVTSHFAILPDGQILQLHPLSACLWASNGFNTYSVTVEFAGNFPNTKGKCLESKKFGCHRVTQPQIEAGRYLIQLLIQTIGITHVFSHRQSSNMRTNDPGPDVWYHVGQWAIDNLGLTDGGPKHKVGSGSPIAAEWRTWGARASEPEAVFPFEDEEDFELGPLELV